MSAENQITPSEVTQKLAAMKTRADNATKGPWVFYPQFGNIETETPFDLHRFDTMSETIAQVKLGDADGEFIVDARANYSGVIGALQAILELHQPFTWSFGQGEVKSCKHCKDQGANESQSSYPCVTVQAIQSALAGDSA